MPCYDDRDNPADLWKRIDERTAQACAAMGALYKAFPDWKPSTPEEKATAEWYEGHKRLDEMREKQAASTVRLQPVKDVSKALMDELNRRLKGKL